MLPVASWSVLFVAQLLAPPPSPTDATRGCPTEPLALSIGELLTTGDVGRRLVEQGCIGGRDLRLQYDGAPGHRVRLGELRLLRLPIAGRSVGLGIALELAAYPASHNQLTAGLGQRPFDELHLRPALDLPPEWAWALNDYVHTPILVGGSAAIAGAVLWQLLR